MGVGVAITGGIPRFLLGCGNSEQKKPEPRDDAGPDAQTDAQTSNPLSSRVAAVKGDDLYAMTRDVLDALGGVETVVHEGETVFLKPNMIGLPWADSYSPFAVGECTKPEILIAVAEQCLEVGASEVIIGDASHTPSFDWSFAKTLDGSTDLKQEAARLASRYGRKVTLACLDADSPRMVEIPSSTYLEKILVSSLVVDADRIISVPVMKTHSIAQLTLSLKNFIGVTSLQQYGTEGPTPPDGEPMIWRMDSFDHSSPEAIAAIYLDIVEAIKPDLAIIDSSIGIEGNGPSTSIGGITVDMKDRLGSWLLLASTDLVAADATAARVMNHNPADIKQLVMASERGLGEMQDDAIESVGEKAEDLQVDWEPAVLIPWAKPEQA
jgi:uncharacterized protein (DUF362 family)